MVLRFIESNHLLAARLILWPTVLTAIITALRLVFELQGSVTNASGGRLAPLGITWLALVFGAWFGWRLRRAGSTPRLRRAWLWSLLGLGGLVAAVALNFGGLDQTNTSEASYQQLRGAVLTILLVAVPVMAALFVVWPRLAWTLLLLRDPGAAHRVAGDLAGQGERVGHALHQVRPRRDRAGDVGDDVRGERSPARVLGAIHRGGRECRRHGRGRARGARPQRLTGILRFGTAPRRVRLKTAPGRE